ncbi:MAG: hypothetical protein WC444_05750 [Candidatus Paceibacterota bacterium]
MSFWSNKDNKIDEEGFSARSTGCGCCSHELTTQKEVEEAVVQSLVQILAAFEYFNFDLSKAEELEQRARAEYVKRKLE